MSAPDAGRWEAAARWRPAGGRVVRAVDAHTGGEPLRLLVEGVPTVPGSTMGERRRWAMEHLDDLRRALLWEPRGHADMYGCVLTEPVSPGADFGVLFLHNQGWSTMCGHGVIAVVTVAVELGWVFRREPVTEVALDTPAGPVRARARVEEGRVARVSFRNVPSFVLPPDRTVEVPGLGRVRYDLAFGGAFYAYVDAAPLGLDLSPGGYRTVMEAGMRIKEAVARTDEVRHPLEPDLSFLYGTIFVGTSPAPEVHSRNVCVFAEGEVDRSPTGTGVSGRLAIHRARGEIEPGEPLLIESILGTRFTGRVVEDTEVGPHRAVVPEVEGRAWITGRHEFVLDLTDPLGGGFFLR